MSFAFYYRLSKHLKRLDHVIVENSNFRCSLLFVAYFGFMHDMWSCVSTCAEYKLLRNSTNDYVDILLIWKFIRRNCGPSASKYCEYRNVFTPFNEYSCTYKRLRCSVICSFIHSVIHSLFDIRSRYVLLTSLTSHSCAVLTVEKKLYSIDERKKMYEKYSGNNENV